MLSLLAYVPALKFGCRAASAPQNAKVAKTANSQWAAANQVGQLLLLRLDRHVSKRTSRTSVRPKCWFCPPPAVRVFGPDVRPYEPQTIQVARRRGSSYVYVLPYAETHSP